MTKYRKRPIEVDAIQWTVDNFQACLDFVAYEDEQQDLVRTPMSILGELPAEHLGFYCAKSQREVVLEPFGWIIAEPDGDGFYPCTRKQFEATYEPPAPAWNVVTLGDGMKARLVPTSSINVITEPSGRRSCSHSDSSPCQLAGHETVSLYEVVRLRDSASGDIAERFDDDEDECPECGLTFGEGRDELSPECAYCEAPVRDSASGDIGGQE